METLDIGKLLNVCRLLSLAVLENGGETYRAEDVVERTCAAYQVEVEVFALPTGIFISMASHGRQYHTSIKRIKKRGINLARIDTANQISRDLTTKKITLDQAAELIDDLYIKNPHSKYITAGAAAMSVGCFAVLFGGGVWDFLVAALCGGVIQLIASLFRREDMFHFIISVLGGMISALFAIGATAVFHIGSLDAIISASIMALVPGLAMVNSIRDTMRGDLVSGIARAGDVMVIALSIAAGVGVVLGIWTFSGGAI